MSPPAHQQSASMKLSGLTLLLILIVLIAIALRIPGIFTNFWGDEIWSWWIAGQIHSIAGIVLSQESHIDNNHPLATLFLYLMGQNQHAWVYRLPALAAGVGSVVLAGRMMLRQDTTQAVIATLLFTFSYPLIFYSSEARGYAFVVFFSLLTWDFLQKSLQTPSQNDYVAEALFGICCTLGFLSHLMFVNTYTAALVWTLVRVRKLEPTTGLRFIRLMRLHTIPVIFFLLLFHFFIRDMVDGGAPPTSPAAIILQTLSLSCGGAATGPIALLAAAIALLLLGAGLIYLAVERADIWIFYLFAVVIAPAMICTRALFFNQRPQPLMPRYFLISIAMLFLGICPLLSNLWRRSTFWRLALAGMLVLFVIGNVWNLQSLLSLGRGHYEEALRWIAQQSPQPSAPTLALSSDSPIRTQMLIRFYGPRVCGTRPITVGSEPEPWLILNRLDTHAQPSTRYQDHLYQLSGVYPAGNLSGWTWQVYHTSERISP